MAADIRRAGRTAFILRMAAGRVTKLPVRHVGLALPTAQRPDMLK